MKAFSKALATAAALGDSSDDFLCLFARLCGCFTFSGRVKAMPAAGATFVAKTFVEELQPLNAQTSAALPSRLKAPMQARVKAGKLSGFVGYVGKGALALSPRGRSRTPPAPRPRRGYFAKTRRGAAAAARAGRSPSRPARVSQVPWLPKHVYKPCRVRDSSVKRAVEGLLDTLAVGVDEACEAQNIKGESRAGDLKIAQLLQSEDVLLAILAARNARAAATPRPRPG